MRTSYLLFAAVLSFAAAVLAADWQQVSELGVACREGKEAACQKLASIAKTDPDAWGRQAAVRQLDDQELLSEIARGDSSSYVRSEAIRRLTDQALLGEIAIADEDWSVRKEAVGQLTDQAAIAAIVQKDEVLFVREAAVNRIEDQTLLAEIAKTHESTEIRELAVNRLTDVGLLEDVAVTDSDRSVRWVARLRLTNAAVQGRIVDGQVREEEIERPDRVGHETPTRSWEVTEERAREVTEYPAFKGISLQAQRVTYKDPVVGTIDVGKGVVVECSGTGSAVSVGYEWMGPGRAGFLVGLSYLPSVTFPDRVVTQAVYGEEAEVQVSDLEASVFTMDFQGHGFVVRRPTTSVFLSLGFPFVSSSCTQKCPSNSRWDGEKDHSEYSVYVGLGTRCFAHERFSAVAEYRFMVSAYNEWYSGPHQSGLVYLNKKSYHISGLFVLGLAVNIL